MLTLWTSLRARIRHADALGSRKNEEQTNSLLPDLPGGDMKGTLCFARSTGSTGSWRGLG